MLPDRLASTSPLTTTRSERFTPLTGRTSTGSVSATVSGLLHPYTDVTRTAPAMTGLTHDVSLTRRSVRFIDTLSFIGNPSGEHKTSCGKSRGRGCRPELQHGRPATTALVAERFGSRPGTKMLL